jgi:hypothetical protein
MSGTFDVEWMLCFMGLGKCRFCPGDHVRAEKKRRMVKCPRCKKRWRHKKQ